MVLYTYSSGAWVGIYPMMESESGTRMDSAPISLAIDIVLQGSHCERLGL